MTNIVGRTIAIGLSTAMVALAAPAQTASPVAAVSDVSVSELLSQYEQNGQQLKALETENPDIQSERFSGNMLAKEKFGEIATAQRSIARRLPEAMKTSTRRRIRKKEFDEAVSDLDRFLKIWINDIVQQMKSAGDSAGVTQMDFNFIMTMEKEIMAAYIKAGFGDDDPSPGVFIPKNMVYVPGGYFLMGRESARLADDDFPMRIVNLQPFFVDRYEVSNGEYRKFLDYTKRTGDPSVEHPDAPPMKDHTPAGWTRPELSGDDMPVVGVDWFDAYAYAKWVGKRLPTETEWEKSARGMKMREYPWGKEAPGTVGVNNPAGRAFLGQDMDRQRPPAPVQRSLISRMRMKEVPPPPATAIPDGVWPVDKLYAPLATAAIEQGFYKPARTTVSPYMIFHLAGNASEWVSDWYDHDYYRIAPLKQPAGPEKGSARVYRGGSYLSPDSDLAATFRGFPKNPTMYGGKTMDGRPMVGFRCAKSVDRQK